MDEFIFTWREAAATSLAFAIIGGVTWYRFVVRPARPGRDEAPPRDS